MTCKLHTEYSETCATCRSDMLSKEYYYHCTVNTFDILVSGALKRRRTMGGDYISLWMTECGLIPDSGRYYDAPDQKDEARYGESVYPLSSAFIWRASINPEYVPTSLYGAASPTNLSGTEATARVLATSRPQQGLAFNLPSSKAMAVPAKPIGPVHASPAATSAGAASASASHAPGIGALRNKLLKISEWPAMKGKGEHLCPVDLTIKQRNFLGLRVPAKREADFLRLIGALYLLGEKDVPVALGNMNFVEAGVKFSEVEDKLKGIGKPPNPKYFLQRATILEGKALMRQVYDALSNGSASTSSVGSSSLAQMAR